MQSLSGVLMQCAISGYRALVRLLYWCCCWCCWTQLAVGELMQCAIRWLERIC